MQNDAFFVLLNIAQMNNLRVFNGRSYKLLYKIIHEVRYLYDFRAIYSSILALIDLLHLCEGDAEADNKTP